MKVVICGLSITSSWGNGHATVYRGLSKALHRRRVQVTFVEKDVPWYASNRDLPCPEFAQVRLYQETEQLMEMLEPELRSADALLLGSYFPDGIAVAEQARTRPDLARMYYDIDTPVTLGAFAATGAAEYLRADQIPIFDCILSFTGGRALRELEERWHARRAVAFYCALDPETYQRTEVDSRFQCRLGYMGTYSADRSAALESLFLEPARRLPARDFVLAGPQYPPMTLPANVRHFHHVAPPDHSALYSSSDLTLNLTRGPMVAYGYSPSVRLFEAAGCGCCVVSDPWDGLGELFSVGRELLVARTTEEMTGLLETIGPEEADAIGERFWARVMAEHTYDVRAEQLLELASRP